MKLFLVALLSFQLVHFSVDAKKTKRRSGVARVKNVILMVGHGMGYHELHMAEKVLKKQLFILTLGHMGIVSAPVDADPKAPLLNGFKGRGMSTGLVTTGALTDNKANYDVLMGGGRAAFSSATEEEFKKRGFQIAHSASDLPMVHGNKHKRLLGLFHNGPMNFAIDREEIPQMREEPPVKYMTQKALELLSKSRKGFLLVVEAARISDAKKSVDTPALAYEVMAFDEAVREAHSFTRKNKNTLLIVTADYVSTAKSSNLEKLSQIKVSNRFMADQLMKKNGTVDLSKTQSVILKHTGIHKVTEEQLEGVDQAQLSNKTDQAIGNIVSSSYGEPSSFVPIFSYGVRSNHFTGRMSHVDVSSKIARLTRVQIISK